MIEPGAAIVIGIYAVALAVIVFFPSEGGESRPWWRNVRFWAALAALSQMAIYAVFG